MICNEIIHDVSVRGVLNIVNGRRYGWRWFCLVSFMELCQCDCKLRELVLCSRRYCSILNFVYCYIASFHKRGIMDVHELHLTNFIWCELSVKCLISIDIELDFTTVLEQVLGLTVLWYRIGRYRGDYKVWVNKTEE